MTVCSLADLVKTAFAENGVLDGRAVTRVTTGIAPVDAVTGGLSGGEMLFLAARTNSGKTTTLMEMARQAAMKRKRTSIISLEDGKATLGERIQSKYTGVRPLVLRVKGPAAISKERMNHAIQQAENDSKLGMRFVFPASRSLDRLLETVKQEVQEGTQIIYIDYMTRIFEGTQNEPRSKFNKIITDLKDLGGELDVPIVLAAQVRRPPAVSPNQSKEPTLYEIKETSMAEDSAEIVVMLWREEREFFGKVAKNKFGNEFPRWKWTLDPFGDTRIEVIDDGSNVCANPTE